MDSTIWRTDREIAISDRLWRTRFAADPGIIGRSVRVNGFPHTIVGVMPVGFTFPGQTDIWQGLVWNLNFHSRGAHFMEAVARDPLTMVSVLAAVVIVGLVACLIPGRRASLTDPIGILRGD